MPLAGRPMVEWSVEAFRAAGAAAIVIAVPPGSAESPGHPANSQQVGPPGNRAIERGAAGAISFVAGGTTRAESVSNALQVVETELVAIHDAARPLVTPELIEGVVATLLGDSDAAGAIAATPVTDTIKRVPNSSRWHLGRPEDPNRHLVIGATEDRSELWAAQTPQVFRTAALRDALEAHPDPGSATDEAMLVEAAGGRVLIHPASPENLKVTTPFDLALAERLLCQ